MTTKTRKQAPAPAPRPIRRIAINTGGGDAPGLNAVIRAAVKAAHKRGWEVLGIRDGYNGIMQPYDYFPESGVIELTAEKVRGITHLGGTILGTTNKGSPMEYPMLQPDGSIITVDRTQELVDLIHKAGIDAVIAVGGDGSLTIANALAEKGLRVVGVPKTIDNDLDKTVATFGFDTAVAFATDCIDRLHSTAEAHKRVIVVEVMGRYAGWIALNSGISGSADVILIPEIPYDIDKVIQAIRDRDRAGRKFTLVVVAEGAKAVGGRVSTVESELGRAERLGGVGERVGHEIRQRIDKDVRVVVLGHLLRGGSPTTFDRLLSLRFGAAAVRALEEGQSGVMVALDPPTVRYVPLTEVAGRMKQVPLDSDSILTARDLGISFGD